MKPNLLMILPILKNRLAEMPEIAHVQGVQELSQLAGEREIQPLDGTVYVVFDGSQPLASSNNRLKQKKKRLSFSVILAKQFYGAEDVPHEDDAVGELLYAICAKLQGWQPVNEQKRPITTEPFDEVQALEPIYFDNFALYPLRFETEILSTYSGD